MTDDRALEVTIIVLILIMIVLVVGAFTNDRNQKRKIEELQQQIRVFEEKLEEKVESP